MTQEIDLAQILEDLAFLHGTDKGTRKANRLSPKRYTLHYGEHLKHYTEKESLRILEIGVYEGASLRMWRDAFPQAMVYGIDVKPECKKHEDERIEIHIGDQKDKWFLRSLGEKVMNEFSSGFDLVVDDGSHMFEDQNASLKALFPFVSINGWYVIEDIRVGYQYSTNVSNSLMPMLMRQLHGIRETSLHSSLCSDPSIQSLHLYRNILFIQKG